MTNSSVYTQYTMYIYIIRYYVNHLNHVSMHIYIIQLYLPRPHTFPQSVSGRTCWFDLATE